MTRSGHPVRFHAVPVMSRGADDRQRHGCEALRVTEVAIIPFTVAERQQPWKRLVVLLELNFKGGP
jgi:hypothetical protein